MSDNRSITARFTADTSGFSPKVNELIQHLKSLNSEYAANEQEIKRLNTEMKGYRDALQKLEQKQRENKTLTDEEKARMNKLRDSIARCATQLGTYRSAQSTLRSDINQTSRELNAERDAVNGVSDAAASFGDVLKANVISDVVHMGLQKTLALLRSAVAYCYQVGTSFEAAMSQVKAISGASASQLEQLTNKAKELGHSTKFTATQVANAMNYMAMAGWDAEQMLSGIDGVLSLAAASGGDLGETSDIVTDALTAFGLKAEDVGHFSDVLAAAAANANTNVSLMGETFKYCAADAGSFGFSVEDTVTAIGLMASAGIKGSQAGTALRKLFTEMSGDLKITSESMGDITVKTADAEGKMRPFIDIIKELREEFTKLNPQEQAAAANKLVGQYAQTGFKTLMNASEEDFKKLTGAIENCDGAAEKMAETMQDNLAGKVTIMESALEGLGIAVYDKFGGALKDVVDIFTDCFSDMTESVEGGELDESISHLADSFHSAAVELADFVSDNLPDFIDGLANVISFVVDFREEIGSAVKGFVAFKAAMAIDNTVRAAVDSFKALGAAIKGAATSQEGLNAAMSANPFGVVAAAIGLVVAAASELEAHLDDCNEAASDAIATVGDLIDESQEYLDKSKELNDITTRFEEITNSEEDARKKTDDLTQLQQTLISLCGSEAGEIDLVTGAFENQATTLSELNRLRDEYNQKSAQDAQEALDRLNEAEQYDTAVKLGNSVSGGYNRVLWGVRNLGTVDAGKTTGAQAATKWNTISGLFGSNTLYLKGTYEERLADLNKLRDYLIHEAQLNTNDESVKNVDALIKQMQSDISSRETYQKQIANLQSGLDKDSKWYDSDNLIGPRFQPELQSESNKVKSVVRDVGDTISKTAEITAGKVKNSLDEVKSAYKSTLDAIDAELEKHSRSKQDEDYQSKIDALTARLKYEQLDNFSRIALESELADIREQWDEVKYQRNAADTKAMLNTVYTQAQSAVDYVPSANINQWNSVISAAIEQIGGGAGNVKSAASSSDSAVYNIVVNAQNKTTDQIVREVTAAISKRTV